MNAKKILFIVLMGLGGRLSAEEISTPTVQIAPEIQITYPREGMKIPAVRRSFVLGFVKPASATVTLNGSTIAVYHTGSFSAMIPYSPGEFRILAEAELNGSTASAVRNVLVNQPPETLSTATLAILPDTLAPTQDLKLPSGENFSVRFRGTPGAEAHCRFKSKNESGSWQAMQERDGSPGNYDAQMVLPKEQGKEFSVEFRLSKGKKSITAAASGKVRSSDPQKTYVVEVSTGETILRTGPAVNGDTMGYDLFVPRGVKLKAQGFSGNEVRLKLSDSEILWGDEKHLALLPETVPAPSSVIDGVHSTNREKSLVLSFDLRDKVPFRAILSDDNKTFKVRLYYTVSNLDRIRYDTASPDPWAQEIRWAQKDKDQVEISISLREKVWGYHFRYEGSRLVCEIAFAPAPKKIWSGLEGILVAVDPGHSPVLGDGAVSPAGHKEGDVNFMLAGALKDKLEKLGAKVFMTREKEDYVALAERGKRAAAAGADLFVSVHTNAVPDGTDPMARSGYSVFYFHPMSLAFAKFVHSSFPKYAKMQDDGLYYGNLAVCRPPQIPSILVEAAYLIRPDEEELLLDPDFQNRAAEGIAQGILDFIRSTR